MTTGSGPRAFMGLPRGSADLLPDACRTRRFVTQALLETFERWGYEQVMTPVVEYYEVLARGLTETDRRGCVRFIEAGSGAVVALRSDLTPQIARMMAHHREGALARADAVRLCYAADVVRQPGDEREATEHHQAGVELIGDADPTTDAEVIALCDAALRRAGLSDFCLDLSHRGVVAAVLDRLGLAERERTSLVGLLARKDRGGVEAWLHEHRSPEPLKVAVAELCDLYGPALQVLPRAGSVLEAAGVREGLTRLEEVLSSLRAIDPDVLDCVVVDLGQTRGFDYYTGLRLRAWAPGVASPVARGGRYDHLLERYGAAAPATGFAIDLDGLEAALQSAGKLPSQGNGPPGRLIALDGAACAGPGRVEAARLARLARAEGARAWVAVDLDRAAAMKRASEARAVELTHVRLDEQGHWVLEHLHERDGKWSPSRWTAAEEQA